MSEAAVQSVAALPVDNKTLKIVLFGMPDAGKTSLLGALSQSSQTQGPALGGVLEDVTGELVELQRQVYEVKAERTSEEVGPYPVRFQPGVFEPGDTEAAAPKRAQEIVFFDCDGRAANEYLSQQKNLTDHEHTDIARAILEADTLLLVVDASSRVEVLKRDFSQFLKFLRLFEQSRSRRSEVNGLPVYLVLTKCDLLARNNDTAIDWMDRIEEHKRKIDKQFRSQLSKQRGNQPFGKIDLHVWATAIKRPALGEAPAKPREPYQVAELFRQTIQSATAFHHHRRKAQRRLHLTFAGVFAVAAVMLILTLAFLWMRETPAASLLESRIRNFRTGYEQTSVKRFAELDETIPRLTEFQEDAAFGQIDRSLHEWVEAELTELKTYREFERQIEKLTKMEPTKFNEEEKLLEHKRKLESLTPPEEYETAWQESWAVQRRKEHLEDVTVIAKEVKRIKQILERVKTLVSEAKKLVEEAEKLERMEDPGYFQKKREAKKKVDQALKLGKELDDFKHTSDIPVIGSDRVEGSVILDYKEISQGYDHWDGSGNQSWKSYLKEQQKKLSS